MIKKSHLLYIVSCKNKHLYFFSFSYCWFIILEVKRKKLSTNVELVLVTTQYYLMTTDRERTSIFRFVHRSDCFKVKFYSASIMDQYIYGFICPPELVNHLYSSLQLHV